MPALSSMFFLQSPVCFSKRSRRQNQTKSDNALQPACDLMEIRWLNFDFGFCLAERSTHLLFQLLLDLLQVGPQIHGHLVFGAQQGSQHGIGWHPHPLQDRLLEILPVQILNLWLQIIYLKKKERKNASPEMCVGGDSEWKGPLVHLLVGLFNFELHVVSLLIHQINLLVKFPTQFLKMRNKWRRRSRHAERMSGWFNSSATETISAPDSRVKTYFHLHFFDGVDSLFSLTFGLPGESSCSLGWTGWDTCPPGTSSSPQLPSAPPPPTWPHQSAAARSGSKTRSVWKLGLVCGKGI